MRDRFLRWQAANPDKHRKRGVTSNAKWRAKNPAKANAIAARHRARKRNATPALTAAERRAVVALYALAAKLTLETGIAHHVDHDKPLARGGLHHPDNLIVVPAGVNLAKGARYGSLWDFVSS